MVNTDRLAEVVALMAERDEEFCDFNDGKLKATGVEETIWALSNLKQLMGYADDEKVDKAVNKAKISASNSDMSIKDNFIEGDLFSAPGEVFVTKYAALLIIMNADVRKPAVSLAQHYFALQVDRQQLEDEKRLKARLDVASENSKLNGAAQESGVVDFQKFNGMGIAALYGNRNVGQIQKMKGLKKHEHYLDFAGSEELAANLFRITQTAAALRRQNSKSEQKACETHQAVGRSVRKVIIDAGNTPPEQLPKATHNVNTRVATRVKKSIVDQKVD